jgi:hypothetical protein
MAELDWALLETTLEHLQNLLSQGYMAVAELATCLVPTEPAFPAPGAGYVVECWAFYD